MKKYLLFTLTSLFLLISRVQADTISLNASCTGTLTQSNGQTTAIHFKIQNNGQLQLFDADGKPISNPPNFELNNTQLEKYKGCALEEGLSAFFTAAETTVVSASLSYATDCSGRIQVIYSNDSKEILPVRFTVDDSTFQMSFINSQTGEGIDLGDLAFVMSPEQIAINGEGYVACLNQRPLQSPIADTTAEMANYFVTSAGYGFPNYGEQSRDLTAEDLVFMFDRDKVCLHLKGPCVPTAVAQQWLDKEIKTASSGHSYGLAVSSLALFTGIPFQEQTVNAASFQASASNAFDMRVRNSAVSNYIMYYFVSQTLAPVYGKASYTELNSDTQTAGLTPVDILKNIIDSLEQGDPDNYYLLGIERQEQPKNRHILIPYAVEEGDEGETWVWVYDNQYPGDFSYSRVLLINQEKDTWYYNQAANPSETSLIYRGDATSNTLYLIPLSAHKEKFVCPFCSGDVTRKARNAAVGSERTLRFHAQGESQMLIELTGGKRIGTELDTGREINEITDSFLIREHHSPTKNTPSRIEIPMQEADENISILLHELGFTSEQETSFFATGPNYIVGLEDLRHDPNEIMALSLQADGQKISFTANEESEPAPQVFMAFDPEDGPSELPGYIFRLEGGTLKASKTLTYEVNLDSKYVDITNDNQVTDSTYHLHFTHVSSAGHNHFKTSSIDVPAGQVARIEFDAWDGSNDLLYLKLDNEGDGFEDDLPVQLKPGECIATYHLDGALYIPCVLVKGDTYHQQYQMVLDTKDSLVEPSAIEFTIRSMAAKTITNPDYISETKFTDSKAAVDKADIVLPEERVIEEEIAEVVEETEPENEVAK